MKVCHFCGANNEDWMKICQECGNPIIDTSSNKNTKEKEEPNHYLSSYEEPKKENNNKDLKIVIIVLSIVLLILVIYTVYILISDGGNKESDKEKPSDNPTEEVAKKLTCRFADESGNNEESIIEFNESGEIKGFSSSSKIKIDTTKDNVDEVYNTFKEQCDIMNKTSEVCSVELVDNDTISYILTFKEEHKGFLETVKGQYGSTSDEIKASFENKKFVCE